MAHPRKPPYRRTNLAKISYASRVIAHFVPNFVAMATGIGREKNAIVGVRWRIPKNPPIGAKIMQKSPTQAEL